MNKKKKLSRKSSSADTNDSCILLYQTEDGRQRIEVRLVNETVWLTQKLMAELFSTTMANINMHLRNIFKEVELQKISVIKDYLITASDGKDFDGKRSAFSF